MTKKKAFRWIFGVLFVIFIVAIAYISTKFTIRIMTFGLDKYTEDYNLMRGMAIALQVTTTLFAAGALLNNKINAWVRAVMLIISLLLFFASIVANIAHVQNKSNQSRNNEIKQSSEYQQAQEKYIRQKQLYESKLQQIQNETDTFDATISATKDTLSKSNAAWERNKHTDLLNQQTENKTKTLERLNNELNNIIIPSFDINNITMTSENGYTSTFQFLAETRLIKWIFGEIYWELLQNYFYIMQSSIFEFINMISLYLFSVFLGINISLKKSTTLTPDPEPKQKISKPTPKENTPKLNLVKSNSPLSLKASKGFHLKKMPKDISDSDIKKYLKFMYEYAEKNNTDISPGYGKISKNIGLKPEECRKILAWLSHEGIVRIEGGRTVIVKTDKSLVG